MALIVTPGSPSADSYTSLAQAAAYHTAMGNAAWGVDTAAQEPALRRATAWLDGRYKPRWPGIRINGRSQALDWPRSGVTDRDGFGVDYLTIPAEIINATCEAALRELAAPGSLSPDYVASEQTLIATAGPVSVTFKDSSGAASIMPILSVADGILSNLIGGGRNSVSLVRA